MFDPPFPNTIGDVPSLLDDPPAVAAEQPSVDAPIQTPSSNKPPRVVQTEGNVLDKMLNLDDPHHNIHKI